ncbi:hypothetical protein K438DRAFT_980437 [Mycena galopus ATCC 62051]|nr:hypothetical protein K438DRAFT_980437 [Mycena galopus ATCC 62051]
MLPPQRARGHRAPLCRHLHLDARGGTSRVCTEHLNSVRSLSLPCSTSFPSSATPRAPKYSLLLPFSRHLPYANPDLQASLLTGVASALTLVFLSMMMGAVILSRMDGSACLSAL